jgi:hypothetical protein
MRLSSSVRPFNERVEVQSNWALTNFSTPSKWKAAPKQPVYWRFLLTDDGDWRLELWADSRQIVVGR